MKTKITQKLSASGSRLANDNADACRFRHLLRDRGAASFLRAVYAGPISTLPRTAINALIRAGIDEDIAKARK